MVPEFAMQPREDIRDNTRQGRWNRSPNQFPAPRRSSKRRPQVGKSSNPLRPGDKAPVSGIYDIVGPHGGPTGEQVVSVEGRPLPPTDKPGQGFVVADESAGRK